MPCDDAFYADIATVLDTGAVEHRRRSMTDHSAVSSFVGGGVKSAFGLAGKPTSVIEVRASELARARRIVAHHSDELERAAEHEAGFVTESGADGAEPSRTEWREEISRKTSGGIRLVRLALLAGMFLFIASIVTKGCSVRKRNMDTVTARPKPDWRLLLRQMGHLKRSDVTDDVTLELQPTVVKLSAKKVGERGVMLSRRRRDTSVAAYGEGRIYLPNPSNAVSELLRSIDEYDGPEFATDAPSNFELHGRAVELPSAAAADPVLRAYMTEEFWCQDVRTLEEKRTCRNEELNDIWVLIAD